MIPNYKLKQYKTPEEIECASYQNQITIEDLQSGTTSTTIMDIDGNEIELTWSEKKQGYESMQYWGFITPDHVIHFWIKENHNIEFEKLLFFFGHEMGHNAKGGKKPKSHDEYINNNKTHWKEEARADEYGFIAQKAYEFAKTVNNLNK
jgi:hypothetical protein